MNSNKTSSGGIGFCGLLTIAFIVLKLTGYITWSWMWVLSPVWISLSLVIVCALILAWMDNHVWSDRHERVFNCPRSYFWVGYSGGGYPSSQIALEYIQIFLGRIERLVMNQKGRAIIRPFIRWIDWGLKVSALKAEDLHRSEGSNPSSSAICKVGWADESNRLLNGRSIRIHRFEFCTLRQLIIVNTGPEYGFKLFDQEDLWQLTRKELAARLLLNPMF